MMCLRWKSPLNAPHTRLLWLTALLMIIAACRRVQTAKIELSSRDQNDGWRPIVGNQQMSPLQDEITHYRNPSSKKANPVKAEENIASTMVKKALPSGPGKMTSQSPKPLFMLPTIGMHTATLSGPALGSLHHPQRPHKFNHLLKIHKFPSIGVQPMRSKPVRQHPVPAFSTRDEVFVPAPSSNVNIGPYTFYSAVAPPAQKPRPTAHSHIEFANHFPIPNTDDELYQIVRAPVHQYVIPHHAKTSLANDVHYTFQNPEEFHRNIPPSPYRFESAKLEQTSKTKKDKPRQEAFIKVHPFHISTPQPQGLPGHNKVDVEITKEKLKLFHNVIPPNYSPFDDFDFRQLKVTPPPKRPVTYEVTEGKWNQETPVFQYHFSNPIIPVTKKRLPPLPPRVITEEAKPFLPTPVKPDTIPPTLPTEGEIVTVYNQVKLNRLRTPTPITQNHFDVKEVSTHFPIIGSPEFQTVHPPRFQIQHDEENEITTKSRETEDKPEIETTTIPFIPVHRVPNRHRRPNRRRRPSSSTTEIEDIVDVQTGTELYEPQKMEIVTESAFKEITTSRPIRMRPTRHRSTTISPPTSITKGYHQEEPTIPARTRHRRPRPTTTEEPKLHIPDNHKEEYESLEDKFAKLTTTTEKDFPANFASQFTAPFKSDSPIFEQSTEETYKVNKQYTNPPIRGGGDEQIKIQSEEIDGGEEDHETDVEEVSASVEEMSNEDDRILEDLRAQFNNAQVGESGKHEVINAPENELDYTTKPAPGREEIGTEAGTTPFVTIVAQTASPTTTTTTTTTTTLAPSLASSPATSSTTEFAKRIRVRPVKYDSSSRPRFSVKDYRQRLSTTTTSSTMPTSTSEAATRLQSDAMRIRFPNRARRPITPPPTIAAVIEDETDERTRFQPHHPRHPNLDNVTEKLKFNTINTRVRPFGRFKTTTEATTTTVRVSIKPNLFGNFRRPTPISLKTRILNRQRNNTTMRPDPTTFDANAEELVNETDQTETIETTIPYSVEESSPSEVTFEARKVDDTETTTETGATILFKEKQDEDVSKQDDFVQSQIVSELTSSLKNDYNTPGLFKNVQPNSRKVPSYFTLATDDPILPIEAFFPKLKDKQR